MDRCGIDEILALSLYHYQTLTMWTCHAYVWRCVAAIHMTVTTSNVDLPCLCLALCGSHSHDCDDI